jgi:uncharacterized repeat protein (TIGR03803 family)
MKHPPQRPDTKPTNALQFAVIALSILAVVNVCLAQTFTVLHNFAGPPDGAGSFAELLLSGNTLYGTSGSGGTATNGTVFKINTDGTGYTVLYSFLGPPDGAGPGPGLVLSGSTLYGNTSSGGSYYNAPFGTPLNRGTLFEVNTDGTGYAVLYNFAQSGIGNGDGGSPHGTLVMSGSTLYGTTYYGGDSNHGTVWEINTDGTGYALIHGFTNSLYGQNPATGLTLSGSTLFGTTFSGGSSNLGTVFKINTNGTGYAVLKNFAGGDGWSPNSALVLSGTALYGTTGGGGSFNHGTVFTMNTDGTGFRILYNFSVTSNNTNSDGAGPRGLTLAGNTLYGTTGYGGTSGYGTIFSLSLPPPPPQLTIAPDGYGGYFINAQGLPNFTCQFQRAPNLTGPWATSVSQTADTSG